MKFSNTFKKAMIAAALMGFSVASSASTVYDNVTTTFDIAPTNTQAYAGTVDGGGYDLWTINLTHASGLVVNLTNATSNGTIQTFDETTAVNTLLNISKGELLSSDMTVLGGADATYNLLGTATWASLESSIYFAVNKALQAGTYYLKLYGDANTSYDGSISAVPLPGAALLFGSALLGMGALRRKQNAEVTAA